VHSGFPSYSADGKEIVFRVWGAEDKGLRIINLDTRKVRVLTTSTTTCRSGRRTASASSSPARSTR
jgi:hypothetical protein